MIQPTKQQIITWTGGIIIGLGILGAIFALGWHYGSANQSKLDKKAIAASSAAAPSPTAYLGAQHQVFVGDVTKVSDKQVAIKTTSGQTQTAAINSKTIFTSAKATPVTIKDVVVGSHVFVTCAIDSHKSLTAQRILIIH
jgi:hypothetical protein